MSDIKLFNLASDTVEELPGQAVAIEKTLQTMIETHLEALLGVRFLASEYSTGKAHGGRIDTLGIDENGFPVIIEYKRATNENVINQGLFYLSWLVDHKGEFELLVMKRLGQAEAEQIEWSNPRLICIAGDFTRYDEHAVQQMNGNIELIRYRTYADHRLLLLELVNAVSTPAPIPTPTRESGAPKATYKTVSETLDGAPETLQALYDDLEHFLLALGDDVQKKVTKYYFAFKRIKNFACIEVHPHDHQLLIFVKVDPDTVDLVEGFTRDVRNIGHFATGDLEIRISNHEEFEWAKAMIVESYENS